MTTSFEIDPLAGLGAVGRQLSDSSTEDLLALSERLYRKLDTADPALEVWDQYDALTADLERRAAQNPTADNSPGAADADSSE